MFSKIDSFEIAVQKRLMRIKELWAHLTAFYFLDNAPATNNPVENYYSTSLKTHRKKQLDVPGIEDQMKLSALKRAGIFGRPEKNITRCIFYVHSFLGCRLSCSCLSFISRISGSFLDLIECHKYFKKYLDKLLFKLKKLGQFCLTMNHSCSNLKMNGICCHRRARFH